MTFSYQDILDFWFEGVSSHKPINNRIPIVKKWFKVDAEFDELLRQKFFVLFQDSVVKALIPEVQSAQERLAKIILFDQFPRNIFRHTSKMFAFDSIALQLCFEGLKKKEDQELKHYERIFFYMPLMHAENLKFQEQSVLLFADLHKLSLDTAKHSSSYYASNLQYARQHYETIKRFGRFPARNQILQRKSTLEEIEFLKK